MGFWRSNRNNSRLNTNSTYIQSSRPMPIPSAPPAEMALEYYEPPPSYEDAINDTRDASYFPNGSVIQPTPNYWMINSQAPAYDNYAYENSSSCEPSNNYTGPFDIQDPNNSTNRYSMLEPGQTLPAYSQSFPRISSTEFPTNDGSSNDDSQDNSQSCEQSNPNATSMVTAGPPRRRCQRRNRRNQSSSVNNSADATEKKSGSKIKRGLESIAFFIIQVLD